MKYRNITSIGLTAVLLSASCLNADWTLIEDYEDGSFPDGHFNLNTVPDGDGEGGNFIVEDPLDPSNHVNEVVADTGEIIYSNNFNVSVFPLQTAIPEGSKATFYHRHMKSSFRHDVVWGLSAFPPLDPSIGYYGFDEMTVAVQYSSRFNYIASTDTYYMGIDGVRGANEIWSPELNVFYHTWLVIDMELNTYDVYIQGGVYDTPTAVISAVPFKQAIFPGASTNSLGHVFFFSIEGTVDNPRGVDPIYFDDIYIDYTGENLTIPEPQSVNEWLGYPVGASGWVDTGEWMGFLYTEYAPYIYSQDLAAYIYLEDNSGWIYSFKD